MQEIQDLEKKGAEKDKKIANLTTDAETLKVIGEKQDKLNIKDLNSC